MATTSRLRGFSNPELTSGGTTACLSDSLEYTTHIDRASQAACG